MAHGGLKTTLAEAMLFIMNSERLGRVEDGTTTSDYDLRNQEKEFDKHFYLSM